MAVSFEQLKPHQRAILGARTQFVVVDGGAGTAKTTAVVLRRFNECILYPGLESMALMQTLDQIYKVYLSVWKAEIDRRFWVEKSNPWRIELKNGSKVYLQYADNPRAEERILGATLAGADVGQAESFRRGDLLEQLEIRIRQPGKPFLFQVDSNGGNVLAPAYLRYIDQESPTFQGDNLKRVREADDWSMWVGTNMTRIHIRTTPETSVYSAEQIEKWRRTMPPARFRRWIDGESCADEGLVYPVWENSGKEPPDPSEVERFWIGMDPGTAGTPNLGLVWLGELKAGGFVVLADRLISASADAQDVNQTTVAALLEQINSVNDYWCAGNPEKFRAIVRDWGGGSGEVFASELQGRGIQVWKPHGEKGRAAWKSVHAGMTLLDEAFRAGRVKISPRAEGIERDLGLFVKDPSGTPDKKRYDSHLLDALRYVWIRISAYEAHV